MPRGNKFSFVPSGGLPPHRLPPKAETRGRRIPRPTRPKRARRRGRGADSVVSMLKNRRGRRGRR